MAGQVIIEGFLDIKFPIFLRRFITVVPAIAIIAIGLDDADGWGAYSCDPTRKCTPTKLDAASKQAKRLLERYRKACADPRTVWFPSRDQVCSDIPMAASAGSKPAAAAPAVRPSQTIQTKLPVGKRVDEPATDTSGP